MRYEPSMAQRGMMAAIAAGVVAGGIVAAASCESVDREPDPTPPALWQTATPAPTATATANATSVTATTTPPPIDMPKLGDGGLR